MSVPYDLAGCNVSVLGLGPTGFSLARYAAKRGANVAVRDTRESPPSLHTLREKVPGATFSVGAIDETALQRADIVLMSPGVSIYEAGVRSAKARGVTIAGDIELFARHIPNHTHTIGITGSNGKTTTTALTGHLCTQAGKRTLVAGNIGNTVLDELEKIEIDGQWPEVIVLELSSFQLESTSSLQCDAATVLNISDDHLDRYPSLHEYAHTKAGLLQQTKLQVINRDDVIARSMRRTDCASVSFGGERPQANQYGLSAHELLCGDQKIGSRSALRIQGQHNAMNALASVALVSSLEIDASNIEGALATFDGLPHRMALVSTVNHVQYIDDSKATNVGAVVAALVGLGRKAVLIAGGQGKGQDFAPLNEPIRRYARAVVLIGVDAQKIHDAIEAAGVPIVHASTLEDAVTTATQFAKGGDAVLLSPACASLDMFRNYGHRSEVFANAVRELTHA